MAFATFVRLAVLRLAVVRFAVLRLAVVRLAVLRLTVVRFAVFLFVVLRATVFLAVAFAVFLRRVVFFEEAAVFFLLLTGIEYAPCCNSLKIFLKVLIINLKYEKLYPLIILK